MFLNQMVLTKPSAVEFKALVFNYRTNTKSFSLYGQRDVSSNGEFLESIDLSDEKSRIKYFPEIDDILQDALNDGYVLSECSGTRMRSWESLGMNLCEDINRQISKAGSNRLVLGAYLIRQHLVEDNMHAPEGVINPNITVTFNPGQACPIW